MTSDLPYSGHVRAALLAREFALYRTSRINEIFDEKKAEVEE